MSHNNFIGKLLDLKDSNLIFSKEPYFEIYKKMVKYKVIQAILTYKPEACYHCGSLFDDNIIKHGYTKSHIKLPFIVGHPTLLALKKQRYLCRHCSHTFVLSTPIVKKHCFISSNTKLNIAINAKNKISEKDLASYHGVSHSTVSRIIDSAYQSHKAKRNYLPPHLCFDEFKSVKSASGAMSFIFCNAINGEIIDIVENRRLHYLDAYFRSFTKAARNAVKTIVIDIYKPYMKLIKTLFPKAKIIIDRFHVVQLFHRSFNKTRIQMMKKYPEHYNKLKNHWKLLLKRYDQVNKTRIRYNRHFKKRMLDSEVIEEILRIDPELYESYQLYQNILAAMKLKDHKRFWHVINSAPDNISDYMKTSVSTAKKYNVYFSNAIVSKYSNGVLEGLNNKIKVLKRIAFGYRSFYHFKNRIMITQNLVKLKTA